ncbi:MAG: site-2 protease family protein [Clostridiales bacterium]|nr:site-2 protease family protein [Clostridiales bacterium]
METFLYIVIAILILLLMILIHEFGHFIAGRLLGFKIDEFAIGFGPVLLSRKTKRGLKVSLRLLPLGGFCAFAGEDGTEKNKPASVAASESDGENADKISTPVPAANDPDLFTNQKPWKRLIVFVAGAAFNILSAIIFCIPFLGVSGYNVPEVVIVHGGANAAIVRKGDIILAVNDEKFNPLNDLSSMLKKIETGESFTLTVEREGAVYTLSGLVKAEYAVLDTDGAAVLDEETKEPLKGVGLGVSSDAKNVRLSAGEVIGYSFAYPFKMAGDVLGALGGLFTGAVGLNDLSGPVTTIGTMAQIGMLDARNLLVLMPLIAVNLGVFNLLPIPALDGSKVVFVLIEMIRRRPVPRNIEAIIHVAGFLFLILFAVGIDILHGVSFIKSCAGG